MSKNGVGREHLLNVEPESLRRRALHLALWWSYTKVADKSSTDFKKTGAG
jgi:hypothetical protein